MDPITPAERAEYERLRQQMEQGFARITRRIDHVVGHHDRTPDGQCPSCEARQHPQA
ncbi:hypothetical protein [Streptomyces sp. VNUA74]|uniref:hypothetical protein n=1 Tax=Streptomyces sp. VNUA74 TaxID=3062685 RepID=UPI00280A8993|nr:hypothetical protein [Streptomyces sp. VNUA74]WML79159.1 hypothetical protein Q3101_04600 [Streptomyces sp. VNUA74]